MNLEQLFVAAFATWRIANLLVNEAGPFEVFDWLRAQADIRWDSEQERHVLKTGSNNEVGKMLLCIYCTSIWVGLLVALFTLFWPVVAFWVEAILALSAVACLIDRYMEET